MVAAIPRASAVPPGRFGGDHLFGHIVLGLATNRVTGPTAATGVLLLTSGSGNVLLDDRFTSSFPSAHHFGGAGAVISDNCHSGSVTLAGTTSSGHAARPLPAAEWMPRSRLLRRYRRDRVACSAVTRSGVTCCWRAASTPNTAGYPVRRAAQWRVPTTPSSR